MLGGADYDYQSFLKSELDKLFESLVEQHQVEVEKARSLQASEPQASNHGSPLARLGGSLRSLRSGSKESKESTGVETARGGSLASCGSLPESEASSGPKHNWAVLTQKLIEEHQEEFEDQESEGDQQMSYIKDILALRSPWKGVLHHQTLKKDRTKTFSLLPLQRNMHRMQDSERDDENCLQPFVRPPTSLIGSLLIVWDLITIPLELFDEQNMINFLVSVGKFSFGFWVLDVWLSSPKSQVKHSGSKFSWVGFADQLVR